MRPLTSAVLTAVGVTAPLVLDFRAANNPIAISVIVTGTNTSKVQYTTDDVFAAGWDPNTANWFDHPTLVSKTSSDTGNLAVPVTAVRLNCTAYTIGSCYMRVLPNSMLGV